MFYYRTNYLIIVVAVHGVMMLRRPSSLLAVASFVLALLLMNDTFAVSVR